MRWAQAVKSRGAAWSPGSLSFQLCDLEQGQFLWSSLCYYSYFFSYSQLPFGEPRQIGSLNQRNIKETNSRIVVAQISLKFAKLGYKFGSLCIYSMSIECIKDIQIHPENVVLSLKQFKVLLGRQQMNLKALYSFVIKETLAIRSVLISSQILLCSTVMTVVLGQSSFLTWLRNSILTVLY